MIRGWPLSKNFMLCSSLSSQGIFVLHLCKTLSTRLRVLDLFWVDAVGCSSRAVCSVRGRVSSQHEHCREGFAAVAEACGTSSRNLKRNMVVEIAFAQILLSLRREARVARLSFLVGRDYIGSGLRYLKGGGANICSFASCADGDLLFSFLFPIFLF